MTPDEFKNIRHEAGLSQQDLSSKLNVTTRTISRYENGNYDIPANVRIMMQSSDINTNRVIAMPEFMPLELIVNSYDSVSIVDAETSMGNFIIVVASNIEGEERITETFINADKSYSHGQYITGDHGMTFDASTPYMDTVKSMIRAFCYGKLNGAEIDGIGFSLAFD